MESEQAGQVFPEHSDSESDIGLSDLIRHSDQNLSPVFSGKCSAIGVGGGDSVPGPSGSNSSSSSKQATLINKFLSS